MRLGLGIRSECMPNGLEHFSRPFGCLIRPSSAQTQANSPQNPFSAKISGCESTKRRGMKNRNFKISVLTGWPQDHGQWRRQDRFPPFQTHPGRMAAAFTGFLEVFLVFIKQICLSNPGRMLRHQWIQARCHPAWKIRFSTQERIGSSPMYVPCRLIAVFDRKLTIYPTISGVELQ